MFVLRCGDGRRRPGLEGGSPRSLPAGLATLPPAYLGVSTEVPANLSWNPRESLFLQIDAASAPGTASAPRNGQTDKGPGQSSPQVTTIPTNGTTDTANLLAARRKPAR